MTITTGVIAVTLRELYEWRQIDLGHNSSPIAWIGLKFSEMDFGLKATIYSNFQQNLRGKGVNFHFFEWSVREWPI